MAKTNQNSLSWKTIAIRTLWWTMGISGAGGTGYAVIPEMLDMYYNAKLQEKIIDVIRNDKEIKATVTMYIQEEISKAHADGKGKLRHKMMEAWGTESTDSATQMLLDVVKSYHRDTIAIRNYWKLSSSYMWNRLIWYDHAYNVKIDTCSKIHFYDYNGYMFHANYNTLQRRFLWKDYYGVDRPCEPNL